jgi:hypothetical protein
MGREISYRACREAVMDHKAEDKAVEGEDTKTTSLRPTTRAVKLRR